MSLAAVIIISFQKQIREAIPRMSTFKAAGIEVSFVKDELDKAIDLNHLQNMVSSEDRVRVINRVKRIAPVLQGAQILWIDDNPDNNIHERKVMRSLGIFVDLAMSSDEAIKMLKQGDYQVIITDMKRGSEEKAGETFIKVLMDQKVYKWTIIYSSRYKGRPEGAFAVTNRPDHLLHYVMDILERERS